MKETKKSIQAVLTTVAKWLGYFMGTCDGLLIILVIFMAIDCITDFMCAVVDKKFSIKAGFKYIGQKVSILMYIGIASALDSKIGGTNDVLRTKIICSRIFYESFAVIENIEHLGLPIPEKLKVMLKQLLT